MRLYLIIFLLFLTSIPVNAQSKYKGHQCWPAVFIGDTDLKIIKKKAKENRHFLIFRAHRLALNDELINQSRILTTFNHRNVKKSINDRGPFSTPSQRLISFHKSILSLKRADFDVFKKNTKNIYFYDIHYDEKGHAKDETLQHTNSGYTVSSTYPSSYFHLYVKALKYLIDQNKSKYISTIQQIKSSLLILEHYRGEGRTETFNKRFIGGYRSFMAPFMIREELARHYFTLAELETKAIQKLKGYKPEIRPHYLYLSAYSSFYPGCSLDFKAYTAAKAIEWAKIDNISIKNLPKAPHYKRRNIQDYFKTLFEEVDNVDNHDFSHHPEIKRYIQQQQFQRIQ